MADSRIVMTLAALGLTAPVAIAGDPGPLDLDVTAAYETEVRHDASGHEAFMVQDAEFMPTVFGMVQFRYNFNSSDGYTFSSEDATSGFEMSRSRLGASGKIHERVSYKLEGGFSSSSGAFTLFDGYADITLTDEYSLRIGQFRVPLHRESLMSSRRQLAANRSTAEGFFGAGRTQGVQLTHATDRVRARLMFSDGANANNTAFNAAGEADYALTGRVDYLGAGEWSRFQDFTSWRGSETAWMIGGAAHWQEGGGTGAIGGTTTDLDILALTAEALLEGDGFNLFAAFMYQSLDGAGGDFDDMGVVVQGGFFVTEIVELFGRWSAVFADSSRTMDDDFHELTIGLNYYLIEQSHAAKVTFDAAYFPEGQSTSPVSASTSTGVLGSSDEQFNLRAQFQIVF